MNCAFRFERRGLTSMANPRPPKLAGRELQLVFSMTISRSINIISNRSASVAMQYSHRAESATRRSPLMVREPTQALLTKVPLAGRMVLAARRLLPAHRRPRRRAPRGSPARSTVGAQGPFPGPRAQHLRHPRLCRVGGRIRVVDPGLGVAGSLSDLESRR